MIERMRLQEVDQVILSVAEGANISGTDLKTGEPVIIIEKPNLSALDFKTLTTLTEDDRGFIGSSGMTKNIDFVLNDGAVLYSVWSYIHGTSKTNTTAKLRGTEWLEPQDNILTLSSTTLPTNFILYISEDDKLRKLRNGFDYILYTDEDKYCVQLLISGDKFFAVYNYSLEDTQVTTVKQIHNNVFCALDIYYDAVDITTEDHHKVCLHCDKVQVFSDLSIGINDSTKASFTPIHIKSIPCNGQLNKNIATITVI